MYYRSRRFQPVWIGLILVVFFFISAAPAAAETTGKKWTAAFFSNTHFGSPPAITDVIYPAGIYFNWGYGKPLDANGNKLPVPADNFSAVFVSQQRFTKADYQFTVRANDGVRIYIDGDIILDRITVVPDVNFFAQYQFTYPMEEGLHDIRIEYVEYTGQALLQFQWVVNGGFSVYYPDTRFCFAPGQTDAAAYIVDNGIQIYGIDSQGRGYLALTAPASRLAAVSSTPNVNTRIASARNNTIQLFRLITGEYQINIGPDITGKTYVCIFNDVPPDYARVTSFELYQR